MSTTVYLITGANRGIGLGLLKQYAQRPNTTVIAAVRDPTKSAAIEAVVPSKGSKIILVKIDSISETDPFSTATELQTKHGIQHLDVVIANAGIANHWGPALSTPAAELSSHFLVNTVGTLLLFQATLPLLEKSLNPKFVALSTGIASMGDMEMYPLPNTAYGASKAALNFVVRKLHFEHENVTIFPISPGWVQTDMGTLTAQALGMEDAPTTLEDSIGGIVKTIDEATRESLSGKFASFDDTYPNW